MNEFIPSKNAPANPMFGQAAPEPFNWVTAEELQSVVKLIEQVVRPAHKILSKGQAIDMVSKLSVENLLLLQRHAKLQNALVQFKLQMLQLPDGDPMRAAFELMFDTFSTILVAK